MFYPTCYVYKIGTNEESASTTETAPTNKKAEVSTRKKSISGTASPNTTLDAVGNPNKIENTLIKDFANNLLISAQRNNCIDPEKR